MTTLPPGAIILDMPRAKRSYTPDEKRLAQAVAHGANPALASLIVQIPRGTIEGWVRKAGTMGDSEAEEFVRDQKKTNTVLFAILETVCLRRAIELALDGSGKDLQSTVVSAGICGTKLDAAGAPKVVDNTATNTPHPALLPDKPPTDSTE